MKWHLASGVSCQYARARRVHLDDQVNQVLETCENQLDQAAELTLHRRQPDQVVGRLRQVCAALTVLRALTAAAPP
ncbi:MULTISPECIES: hypothetical protein [unclassified Kitasatospora]|uniref:hypothetical protein n=1 Tax=unclassified Kitasatospora TaxID=2633591 RepID=UPI00380079BC